MAVVVQKYGGSSVADLDKMTAVARRVADTRAAGHAVVAVVSAMGHTTDELLDLARRISPRPNRRELDMLVSSGERMATALLALQLEALGVPARSLTGSQSGVITDEVHGGARVVAVRPERVRQVLDGGAVAVVAGFQGVSRTREVTTLGRGGTDTTAVVLAAALDAAWCELCSDVDGVWTADPRVVPDARRLDALGLDEALALARGGAKVLQEDAVRMARDLGVELRRTVTFGPGAGTRLTTEASLRGRPLAVTGDRHLGRVALGDDPPATLEALAAAGARVRHRHGDTVWVDLRNAPGGLPAGVAGHPVARVTAVGSALGEDAALGLRLAGTLEAADLAPPGAPSGGAGDALWWSVRPDALDAAVRLVHAALIP